MCVCECERSILTIFIKQRKDNCQPGMCVCSSAPAAAMEACSLLSSVSCVSV